MSALRVLLVEDDHITCMLLAKLLALEGFVVDSCNAACEALHRLAHAPYDVLVTDHVMPQMTGLELVMHTRSQGLRPRAIIISGGKQPAGVPADVPWMPKPVDIDDLARHIRGPMPSTEIT